MAHARLPALRALLTLHVHLHRLSRRQRSELSVAHRRRRKRERVRALERHVAQEDEACALDGRGPLT